MSKYKNANKASVTCVLLKPSMWDTLYKAQKHICIQMLCINASNAYYAICTNFKAKISSKISWKIDTSVPELLLFE